jgi:hypothetical protein
MELLLPTGLIGYYEGTCRAQAGSQETEQKALGGPKLPERIWTSSKFLLHLVRFVSHSCPLAFIFGRICLEHIWQRRRRSRREKCRCIQCSKWINNRLLGKKSSVA